MASTQYKRGYKYQVYEEYRHATKIQPTEDVPADPRFKKYLELKTDGTLIIKAGYAWDGPSGPTIDTPSFMRGSLVHDALYQLLREKCIGQEWRDEADRILKETCIEDGMPRIFAGLVFWAVNKFAKMAADPSSKKPVIQAPK
ncbi:MAG: hypothetical protein JW712_02450 [Dehalococcoidales bacterium]|nr:hypothetical protein [Dehalococcoidales bacterium]